MVICIQDGDGICKCSDLTSVTSVTDGRDGAATASRQRRIALAVMNYFRRESIAVIMQGLRKASGSTKEVRRRSSSSSCALATRDPEPLITFGSPAEIGAPLFNVQRFRRIRASLNLSLAESSLDASAQENIKYLYARIRQAASSSRPDLRCRCA